MTKVTRFTIACALLMGAVSNGLLAKDKLIDLTVVGSGSNFRIQFLNSLCPDKDPQSGCIEVKAGESGALNWELDSMGETYWMLTRFQFSADGVNWGDSRFPLPDCSVKNFNLEERDQFTGNAASAMITGNGRKIVLPNGNQEACQLFYRIYAMPKAGGMEIHSEIVPMILNLGGGAL